MPDILEKSREHGFDSFRILSQVMIESCGNKNIRSYKDAGCFMQIMPETWAEMERKHGGRSLGCLEAAVLYMLYAEKRFDQLLKKDPVHFKEWMREEFIVWSYHGGVPRASTRLMRRATAQYIQDVQEFYSLLKEHPTFITEAAGNLEIFHVKGTGVTWADIARDTQRSVLMLRWFNPFLARSAPNGLPEGSDIVYPKDPSAYTYSKMVVTEKYKRGGEKTYYRIRDGDRLLLVANVFGILPYDRFRKLNSSRILPTAVAVHPMKDLDVSTSPFIIRELFSPPSLD